MTLIQLDNYGPWTCTLGNDREHKLQMLQSDLYSALLARVSELQGLVFFNRFDEMLAVTNGMTFENHKKIQQALEERFPVTLSMGVGVGKTPFEAQLVASKLLQQEGSAQSPTRSGVIAYERILPLDKSHVQVMHFDVDGITETLTDHASAYQTSLYVMTLYAELMKLFKRHEALVFFAGGDNFIGVANGLDTRAVESVIEDYRERNVRLKCGIGMARTGRKAAELAAMNLDLIREGKRKQPILCTAIV